MDAPRTVSLSLVAHTNVGKTTLARTLLGRDIGEVRDAPHVTEFADVHTMLKSPQGDVLQLWDTPGFGDSVRLVRRLRRSSNPLGWFMSEVWDRWRDRPFWAAQQVVKHIRDEADVLLYLVSAAEAPESAGYVAPEMELLAWTGKPVVILLNQLGTPGADSQPDDLARWSRHLLAVAPAARVLSFDAFARCWVQEVGLLDAVAAVAGADLQAPLARLKAAWRAERLATFDAAMAVLAASLARIAAGREVVAEKPGLAAQLRSLGGMLARRGERASDDPSAAAERRLAERLAAEIRDSTSALIRLHRIEGESEATILESVQVDLHQRVAPGWAAIWGGAVSGALAGLSADVLSGGLTLGGGLLGGGVLGALGAAGLAHGVNRVRGTDQSWLAWKPEALMPMADAALLRYLAVAHFGRGRGRWADGDAPAQWAAAVDAALAPHRSTLAALWQRSAPTAEARPPFAGFASPGAAPAEAAPAESIGAALEPLLRSAAQDALARLYPEAALTFGADVGTGRESALPRSPPPP